MFQRAVSFNHDIFALERNTGHVFLGHVPGSHQLQPKLVSLGRICSLIRPRFFCRKCLPKPHASPPMRRYLLRAYSRSILRVLCLIKCACPSIVFVSFCRVCLSHCNRNEYDTDNKHHNYHFSTRCFRTNYWLLAVGTGVDSHTRAQNNHP